MVIVRGWSFAEGWRVVVLESITRGAGAKASSSGGWDWLGGCCINELTAIVLLPICSAVAEESRAYGTLLIVIVGPPATISEPLNLRRGRVSAEYSSPLIERGGGSD